ncbi:hypothetical protein QSU92_10800 [Microbacterium sp. ET2]|uniref:hypothetical protein n=1 Tax=Microbacterium albipurpureum TaxID=3050384 RepID=UPI00259C9DBC|nr:hypothetical protein [Microbacterium sp. ET2 (Ac-2212)]WJL94466.1 hypothetical protein QSU92_10800 [Microbacterium sp. ET2 (Ac-2212)]
MSLPSLRDDALSSTDVGFELRISLPWIRSLPVWSVNSLELAVDGDPVGVSAVGIGDRRVAPSALAFERGWWFVQDRLRLEGRRMLAPGVHEVMLGFRLIVPYLDAGGDGPLSLPFSSARTLLLDAPAMGTVSRDVA